MVNSMALGTSRTHEASNKSPRETHLIQATQSATEESNRVWELKGQAEHVMQPHTHPWDMAGKSTMSHSSPFSVNTFSTIPPFLTVSSSSLDGSNRQLEGVKYGPIRIQFSMNEQEYNKFNCNRGCKCQVLLLRTQITYTATKPYFYIRVTFQS